jgi:hypothetical protein
MKKKIFYRVLVFIFVLSIPLSCQKKEVENVKKVKGNKLSRENPIIVDRKVGKVLIYTEVNGRYFTKPTRHGIVFKDGKNGNRSILRAYINQHDFNLALRGIGLKPGNNVTLDSEEGTIVKGDALKVTVTWDGADRNYDWGEIVKSEPDKGWEIRYGGNDEREQKKRTGCILCLDSCAVGITSNARWGWKSFDRGKVKFYGNPEILPKDGTPVYVTFSKKEAG